ncbi:hypothetical protein ATO8_09903 [Roseivivax marinus]|uniref:Uncharacterized protein n=1 Tax=Roseivivax marinus TaxID=1379903 RepID=W4HKA1_9RHOB|nr:hypothetical protein [Roseivivax marinus]ETW12848.1 hypothetical protein ATO8_09903 [Roseivivax marinus]
MILRREVLLALGALTLAFGSAALWLRPDPNLGTEADLAALPPAEALARLDAMDGPLAPQLAFRQAALAAEAGDTLRADTLLAQLADRTPEAAAIPVARADLALRRGDTAAAAGRLANAHALAPDPEVRARLGLLLRRAGDTEAERLLLTATPLAELSGAERLRRVDLLAQLDAESALDDAVAATALGGSESPALAQRATALALTSGRDSVLIAAAEAWLGRSDAAVLARSLASGLALVPQRAAPVAAEVIARRPAARAILVTALSEVEAYGAARPLLRPWLEARGAPDASTWRAVTAYAERSGDLGALESLLRRAPDTAPAAALLPFVRYDGAQGLLPWRALLTEARLSEAPLVDAAWAAWRQRPDRAFAALERAARDGADPALWRIVAEDLEGTGYLERLRAMAARDPDVAAMFDG